MTIKIAVAVDRDGGFAKDRKIPWNIPEDFKHFMKLTKGSICICGRNTYEEMLEMKKNRLGAKYNPDSPILSNRITYVVSTTLTEVEGAELIHNVTETLQLLMIPEQKKNVFILGGEQVFNEALPFVSEAIITALPTAYDCDQFFPIDILETQFIKNTGQRLNTKDNGEILVVQYIRVTK